MTNNKSSTENFIKRAKLIHNNKYAYDKVIYTKQLENVIITCPITNHGDFPQKPKIHLKGSGCHKCAELKIQQHHNSLRKSLENFIDEANKLHNYKYDYSKTVYIKNTKDIIIICPIHDSFVQTPKSHLKNNSSGCQKCSDIKRSENSRMTLNEFINSANIIHNNTYSYNNTIYIGSSEYVLITCSIHGNFSQTPSAHLQGQGCKYCGIIRRANSHRYDIKTFIENAIKIHGDKYDYSETIYYGGDFHLDIFCKIHQKKFPQRAASHLIGQGCPDCGREKVERSLTMTFEDFKLAANLKFNYKYDYSKFNYTSLGSTNKSIIICKEHGEISQRPSGHLYSNYGCSKCGMVEAGNKNRMEFEEFVERSNVAHGYKYDYSKFIYKNNNEYGIVICNKLNHNEFKACPSAHMSGDHRCPKCYPMSRGEFIINDFLMSGNYNYNYHYSTNVGDVKNKFVDYYIPSLNLIIEYNGIQHYQPVKFGNQTDLQSEEKFINQQRRDNLIKKYCRNNNIHLLELDGRKYLSPNTFTYIKNKIITDLSFYIFRLKSKLYFTRNKVD